MTAKQCVFKGWTVVDKDGHLRRYQFGHMVHEVVVYNKKEAWELARLLAQREYELASDDLVCWEFGQLSLKEVRKMGYRVVRADVFVRS